MALNLLRNSRVFVTTKVDATTGVVALADHTASTTSEIQVLEGFSFSQNTNTEAITVSEAGIAPVRGQRQFNTSLAPVDFSFSSYIRPYLDTNVKSEDSVLWNALAGGTVKNTALVKTGTYTSLAYDPATNITTLTGGTMSITGLALDDDVVINGVIKSGTGSDAAVRAVTGPARVVSIAAGAITFLMANPSATTVLAADTTVTNIAFYKSPWSEFTNQAILGMHDSNRNQLQKMGLIIIVDNVTYKIDNAALSQATIDFGLDGIATVQWTGQATSITQLATTVSTATAGTMTGGITGDYTQKKTKASYITNKLSTATLKTAALLGTTAANTPYYVAITGGSITINNNITYITPANLGVVNEPAVYYTGNRSITGSLTAYLNTGAVTGFTGGGTGNLLKDMLAAAASAIEPMFALELAVGGSGNAQRVELQMPSISLSVPTIDAQPVISTTLNFTAAPGKNSGTGSAAVYDLARTNDLTVRYYSTTTATS